MMVKIARYILISAAASSISLCALFCSSAKPYTGPLPPHTTADGHFCNTDTSTPPIRDTMLADSLVGTERTQVYPLPIARGNEFLWADSSKSSAAWIGHATYYLRIHGTGILADPIFSDRSSPVSFYGPKRATPPGRSLDSLPPVDLVLISHDHYDHLDKASIKRIHKKYPRAKFAVPLKVGDILRGWDIPDSLIIELDWWGRAPFHDFELTFVPAHHTSRRGAFASSRNLTLWGGWVVESRGKKFWFAGDLAMGDGSYYREIADKFSPVDACFLPIGGYEPSRYTRVHISPRQAVQLHKTVGCKESFAMHWGTFGMTFEKLEAPPKDLARARRELGIADSAFRALRHGEIVEIMKE